MVPPTDSQRQAIHLVATLGQQAAVHHRDATTTMQAVQQQRGDTEAEIMLDSGAAKHVCLAWFAPGSPLYPRQHGQGPQLLTATGEDIPVPGYKWVFMHNINKQKLVVPFYVCEVTQPIMSATRLAEQGFNTQLNETPAITHSKGFTSTLKQRESFDFLPVTLVALQANMRLAIQRQKNNTEVIEEAYQDLDKRQQKRAIQRPNWTGERMTRDDKGNTPSRQQPPPPALPAAKEPTQTTAQQFTTVRPPAPMHRQREA